MTASSAITDEVTARADVRCFRHSAHTADGRCLAAIQGRETALAIADTVAGRATVLRGRRGRFVLDRHAEQHHRAPT